jgi:hypothetical protein
LSDLDLWPSVAWSPDGDRFASVAGFGGDLVVVDASSGEVTALTEAKAPLLRYGHLQRRVERVLGFSPQGDRILHMGWGTGYTPFALYSIGIDGSDAPICSSSGRCSHSGDHTDRAAFSRRPERDVSQRGYLATEAQVLRIASISAPGRA